MDPNTLRTVYGADVPKNLRLSICAAVIIAIIDISQCLIAGCALPSRRGSVRLAATLPRGRRPDADDDDDGDGDGGGDDGDDDDLLSI